MRAAAAYLIGTHNFAAFGVLRDGDPRDPVKDLRKLEIERWPADPSEGGDRVTITAECDRFLCVRGRVGGWTGGCLLFGRLSRANTCRIHPL